MPLLCQIFLSNNKDAHKHLARGGKKKDTLVILVPEHLLTDARTQVFRHCLNLNFRQEYRIYDDILTLLHNDVGFNEKKSRKQIFVTSFNQFKKVRDNLFVSLGENVIDYLHAELLFDVLVRLHTGLDLRHDLQKD